MSDICVTFPIVALYVGDAGFLAWHFPRHAGKKIVI